MPDARQASDRLLMLGLVSVVLVITGYVASAPPRAMYALQPEQALRDFARFAGRNVRVHGLVVPGSLRRSRRHGIDVDIASSLLVPRQRLHVRCEDCSLPDVLCDLSGEANGSAREVQEVHFDGRLVQRRGRVEMAAERVILRCAASYVAPDMAALCARYRAGDYCPVCEHVTTSPRGPL